MTLNSLEEDILELVRKDPLTPDEVAKRLRVSWATANGHLLKLVGEGKATLMRKGRVNVYYVKSASAQKFHVPSWIKPRPLEQLSEELEKYFSRKLTAAEMIGKERRKA